MAGAGRVTRHDPTTEPSVSRIIKGKPMPTTESAPRTETAQAAPGSNAPGGSPSGVEGAEVEVLVEEISIDGMCGVY